MEPHKRITRGQKASAAPGVMTLGDRDLFVRPPTPANLLTVRKWARKKWAADLKAEAGDGPRPIDSAELEGLSPADRLEVLKAFGAARATGRQLTEAAAMDIVTSPEGTALMVYLSASPFHADLTLEWVREQITEDNVGTVLEDFNEQAAVEDPATGEPDLKPAGRPTSQPSSSA